MSRDSSALNSTLGALADPTRREVIRTLLRKPLRAGELASSVEMSPPALSRHLRVLRRAGLIVEQSIEDDARVRVYCVNPQAFEPLRSWLDQVEGLWQAQLQSFKAHAERTRASRGKAG